MMPLLHAGCINVCLHVSQIEELKLLLELSDASEADGVRQELKALLRTPAPTPPAAPKPPTPKPPASASDAPATTSASASASASAPALASERSSSCSSSRAPSQARESPITHAHSIATNNVASAAHFEVEALPAFDCDADATVEAVVDDPQFALGDMPVFA